MHNFSYNDFLPFFPFVFIEKKIYILFHYLAYYDRPLSWWY